MIASATSAGLSRKMNMYSRHLVTGAMKACQFSICSSLNNLHDKARTATECQRQAKFDTLLCCSRQ